MDVRSFKVTDPQNQKIEQVLARTCLTFSELMRRWVDYGLQEQILNEVIPSMSGQLVLQSCEKI